MSVEPPSEGRDESPSENGDEPSREVPDGSRDEPGPPPEAAPVRTVAVGEGTVAYAEYGAADGTPVLFLHGTPGSRRLAELYDAAARRAGVRLLSVDRPGCGRSSPRPGRSLTDTGSFVRPVFDDAGVERAGVVAFSGGGPHALALAAADPDLVREVDVVAGAVPPSVGDGPAATRVLGSMARRTPRLLGGLLRGHAWVARRAPPSFVLAQYTADGGSELGDREAAVVRRDYAEAVGGGASGAVAELAALADGWGFDLADVGSRVVLRHGTADANVPLEGAARLAERLPDAALERVEGADHAGTLVRVRSAVLRRQRR